MDRPKVTIYDVAEAAGVAISTVSRVLNESPEVSDATRARVQAAIEQLRFQPDRTAKQLAKPGASTLAVALPSATGLFYVEVLKGVKDVLRTLDIDLLLGSLGSSTPVQTLRRFLDRGALDGLLLASLPVDDALADALLRMRAPVVLIGSRHPAFDAFWWDDVQGAREAVRHLAELGHVRIGMITAHPWSYTAEARLAGYRAALEEAGLLFDPALVVAGDTLKHAGYSEEAGAEALRKLLALGEPPTAVFASADVQAFGAWAAARDAGLVIPRDLSLVGYDGLKLSRYLGLTTVDQQMQEVGRRAVTRLLEKMQGAPEGPPIVEQVQPGLVVRGSTAPPLHADRAPRQNGTEG
jgi:LacI family transcriptional regulator